jgi:sarcosine oxidase subunit alpha
MVDAIEVTVNGLGVRVAVGTTAAAAVISAGAACRRSLMGESRAPLCGMGVCFECRATVDGVQHTRTCQVVCRNGMVITTDAA